MGTTEINRENNDLNKQQKGDLFPFFFLTLLFLYLLLQIST